MFQVATFFEPPELVCDGFLQREWRRKKQPMLPYADMTEPADHFEQCLGKPVPPAK